MQYVYIVDVYHPFMKNDNILYKFTYSEKLWCVRRVILEWGIPQSTALDIDDNYSRFHIYNTYEEAMEYVHQLRKNENYE